MFINRFLESGITLLLLLWPGVVVLVGPTSVGQIDMFENY